MQKSIVLGVTGGIGSGKSLVCRVMSLLGIPIYYADDQAKYLMGNDLGLMVQIKRNFGEQAYSSKHILNRSYLSKQVFSDPEKLSLLNSLVHPVVKKSFDLWCAKMESQNHPILVKEAALLLESGSYKSLDKLIVVSSPQELKIRRVLVRDTHRAKEDVLAIMNKQWSEEKKIAKADFVIRNDETELVIPQVNKILEDIKKAIM